MHICICDVSSVVSGLDSRLSSFLLKIQSLLMDSSGFSSPRSGDFPAGLRVLVVDDDPAWLKTLEKMLKKCNYEVTTCKLTQEALDLLRERKGEFDIVIGDVNIPHMDGFKLLEHVGLEMDLPVIMMSVDGETNLVMKGVQHGACDYLLKPIRLRELRNIWQHVFRKRLNDVRDIQGQESSNEIQTTRNGTDQSDDGRLLSRDVMISGKKRKDVDNKHHDRECGDSYAGKKPRVVWTADLHQKFVKAVNQIGFDKAGPKKILDLMGVPWLKRENVASHLQKYRLYLSRLQKENEPKAASHGIKHSDISSKRPAGNVCFQRSTNPNSGTAQQNIVSNGNYAVPEHNIQIHNHDAKMCQGNVEEIISMPMAAEPKKALSGDVTDSPIISTSRISFNQSFGPMDSEVNFEPKIRAQYSWSDTVPSIQFKQELKSCFESEQFGHLPLLVPQIQEGDRLIESINPSYGIGEVTKVENADALFSGQLQSHAFEPIPHSIWSIKNHSLEQNVRGDLESSLKNLVVGSGSVLNGFPSQGNVYPENHDHVSFESFPPHLFESVNFDCEYSVMGQSLFIE